jgi:hypothetical protein
MNAEAGMAMAASVADKTRAGILRCMIFRPQSIRYCADTAYILAGYFKPAISICPRGLIAVDTQGYGRSHATLPAHRGP